MSHVAILDYGMGNLRSVEKALERVGQSAVLTDDHAVARAADGVILPGVGAFPTAMQQVRERGLDELVTDLARSGAPILGICLGMQLIFDSTTELGGSEGIGLIAGPVSELDAAGQKVPHIGWSPVSWDKDSPLTTGIAEGEPFYFVHSFAPRPAAADDVLGSASYGASFPAAVERGNVYGVQFHPEKSSAAGLRLLRNFAAICTAATPSTVA